MEPGTLELLFTSGTLEHGIFSFTGTIIVVSAIFVVLSRNNKRISEKFEKQNEKIKEGEKSVSILRIDHERLKTEFDTRNTFNGK